jgi:hypothetical protein
MTIIRSVGVATLVALMSAHRSAVEEDDAPGASFDQARVDATLAYLCGQTNREPDGAPSSEPPRSYN